MAADKLGERLKKAVDKREAFIPRVTVNVVAGTVTLILSDDPYRHEWIPGEGADIGLMRSLANDRVVGVCLPINWTGALPVHVIQP